MPSEIPEHRITLTDLADELGVSRAAVSLWHRKDYFKSAKRIGHYITVTRTDADRVVKERAAKAQAAEAKKAERAARPTPPRDRKPSGKRRARFNYTAEERRRLEETSKRNAR